MSLATSSSVTCAYCNGPRDKYASVGGSYCSKLCYHKHKGQKLYNVIAHDHTHCVQCSAKLKEVEEPTDEALRQIDGYHSTTAVIGFEYHTPNADVGEKDIVSESGERVITGVICAQCGNTNQTQPFPEWQNRKLLEYGSQIFDTLQEKQDEHHTELCEDTFFEMLYTTEDLVFALGKAAHMDG